MKILRYTAILLLLFNGTAAIFGGWNLMMEPDGGAINLPSSYLQHLPFPDYFLPGLVLFSLIGVFSLITLLTTVYRWRHYSWLIIIQGLVLVGWIIIQMILLKDIFYLQFVFGAIGLALLIIGVRLKNDVHS